MISVSLLFLFFAGVAFLGFIINALFNKLKIINVLPLMIIGLLVGPIFHFVNVGPNSLVSSLAPIITAVALAFILFDVGINMNIFRLGRILSKATKFALLLAFTTGLAISLAAFYLLHYNIMYSLILGFALAGPSSAIIPTLMKSIEISPELKDSLVYESVITDVLQLVVPILLIEILVNTNLTLTSIATLIVGSVVGSIFLGSVLALFWLYILNRFKEFSKPYTWTLTITMVVATYGISQLLNFSSPITIFVFGIIFSNFGSVIDKQEQEIKGKQDVDIKRLFNKVLRKYFYFDNVSTVRNYQREIQFFASTFFFVYIGMLFSVTNVNPYIIGFAIFAIAIMVAFRYVFLPLIRVFIPTDKLQKQMVKKAVTFNISRGLSPAIVATLPLAFGIMIPNFLDVVFLIILFSNIASTIGIILAYRK